MNKALSILCAAVVSLPVALHAEPSDPGEHDHPPVMDKISLDLAVEDWVQTSTAKVTMEVNASLAGKDAGKIRADMLKAVGDLAQGADWKFSTFDRSEDNAGLETWHAELEARLKETDLGGLADKAKQASKPGLQLKIGDIEFTPTLAETEAAKAKLRNQIYGEVNDELKRLQTAEPDRKYRISTIDFTRAEAQPVMRPHMMAMVKLAGAPPPTANDDDAVSVQQKVQIEAHVVLSAVAPKE